MKYDFSSIPQIDNQQIHLNHQNIFHISIVYSQIYNLTTVYTGSYFSGFGYAILLLFCIFILMSTKLRFLKNKNVIIFVLVSLLSLISLNVDISNHYVRLAQAGDMRLWSSVDRLLEKNYNLVREKNICAPTLWQRGLRQGLFHPQSMDSYWNDYASVKYNKTINFKKNTTDCEFILEFIDAI